MSRFYSKYRWCAAIALAGALAPAMARDYYVDRNNPKARDYLTDGGKDVPFKTLAAASHKAQAGDTVHVMPGVYREILVPMHSGTKTAPITFQAEGDNVWIKGSEVVTDWKFRNGYWIKRPWQPRFYYDAALMDTMSTTPYKDSARCEQVFIDGLPLQWTPTKEQVAVLGFWWAPDGSEIALKLPPGMNPNDHLVEIPVRPAVVASWPEVDYPRAVNDLRDTKMTLEESNLPRTDWIVIRGFRFAHNAATINRAGLRVQGEHWLLESNTVEWMNTVGIGVDNLTTARNNVTRFNGQTGFGGAATGVILEDNLSLWDNARKFNPGWGGASLKFARTKDFTVRRQVTVGGMGSGIWFDIDCIDTLIEDCVILPGRFGAESGCHGGIFYEVSYNALIHNNVIFGSHMGFSEQAYGTGVTISASTGVTASNNVTIFCDGGISVVGGPRSMANPPGPFWKRFGLDAYYTKDAKMAGNLFVGDLCKALTVLGAQAVDPAFGISFKNNTVLESYAGSKTIFDPPIYATMLQAQAATPQVMQNNVVCPTLEQASPAVKQRLDWAVERILASLDKIAGPLPSAQPVVVKGIWSDKTSKAHGLFVKTGGSYLLVADIPTETNWSINTPGLKKVRYWTSAARKWQTAWPEEGKLRLSLRPGLTIIRGLNAECTP